MRHKHPLAHYQRKNRHFGIVVITWESTIQEELKNTSDNYKYIQICAQISTKYADTCTHTPSWQSWCSSCTPLPVQSSAESGACSLYSSSAPETAAQDRRQLYSWAWKWMQNIKTMNYKIGERQGNKDASAVLCIVYSFIGVTQHHTKYISTANIFLDASHKGWVNVSSETSSED